MIKPTTVPIVPEHNLDHQASPEILALVHDLVDRPVRENLSPALEFRRVGQATIISALMFHLDRKPHLSDTRGLSLQ